MKPLEPIPIESLSDSAYRRQLLHSFKTKSKYSELWLELKTALQVTYHYNPALPDNYDIIPTGLRKLKKKDSAFAEFCRLTYGDELRIYSRINREQGIITTFLIKQTDQLPAPIRNNSNYIGIESWQ